MIAPAPRRLIVNADDFGRSPGINEAVLRAHRDGILTSASLMVNEPDAADAARLAHHHPRLGVGLHLTLLCGHSALPHADIPGLVDEHRQFTNSPVGAGFRYFFSRRLRVQIRDELAAQFERFRATGLTLDHVNGHLHLHLHPVVFSILMQNAAAWRISHLRLTCDPFRLNARLSRGRWIYRASHALIHTFLAARARPQLLRRNIRHTPVVFGLLQNARVDEDYIARLLPNLPPGDSELYSHPSLDQFRNEFDALVSPRIRSLVQQSNVSLIRYQDL